MLQKSGCLLFDQLSDHVAQNSSHSIESLICGTNIVESMVVKQDLLNNEDGHGFAQLRTSFHNPQTQRNDLRCEQEVDDIRGIVLNQSSYHS